jgi:hypothetical protein
MNMQVSFLNQHNHLSLFLVNISLSEEKNNYNLRAPWTYAEL